MTENSNLKEKLHLLQESLGELELYIEHLRSFLPIAICDVTPTGLILAVNKAFQKLTGYKEIEIVGKPIEGIFLEKIENILKEVLEKGIVEGKELTLAQKNIPVSVFVAARKDSEGNVLGFFWGIIDISEFKILQQELEKRVQEKTRALQEKLEELEKFQKIVVGRELKMIELKREIEKLKKEIEKRKSG